MSEKSKVESLKELQTIPGVGKSIANDLWELGFRSVDDLRGHDPQKMYDDFCDLVGAKIDRCLLYTFRCAVYFASNTRYNPELLKWWNWEEREKI